jgi:hypothetical protein
MLKNANRYRFFRNSYRDLEGTMSTDRQMNFRRVIKALRERKELEEILGVKPGESLVDAAKRLRKSVDNSGQDVVAPAPVGIGKTVFGEMIATIQIVGESSNHVAEILVRLAERVLSEGAFDYNNSSSYDENGQTWAFFRHSADAGENVIDPGTFWGVGYSETFPGEEIAFFANKDLAVRFSQGKNVFDEEEGLAPPRDGDLCVVRACIVGTIWNSTEADPHKGGT